MPRPEIQILVCVNERAEGDGKPNCRARGGLELYRAVKDRIRERHLKDRVLVTRSGCLRHCSRGITVAVWPQNAWYGGVTEQDLDEILETALADAGDIERLRIPDESWE